MSFVERQQIDNNYTVISNLKSYCKTKNAIPLDEYMARIEKGEDVSKYNFVYENDILNIINFCKTFQDNNRHILIFFDEIFSVLENKGSLRKVVRSFLSQLRKRNIIFVTTAQEWAEIHISFRRYVRFQISCSMKSIPFSKKALVYNQINDGDLIHWDETQQDYIAPVIQTNISKGLKSVILLYDTFETIDSDTLLNG